MSKVLTDHGHMVVIMQKFPGVVGYPRAESSSGKG
jgi:hypothetical protein